MPSKPIMHANKGKLVFLNNGSYDQLYSSILLVLGKDAPFAPLTIQGTTLSWSPVKPGRYISIKDAPEDISGSLLVLWEQLKKDFRPRLSAQKLDFVLTIPDSSYIFYMENSDCKDGVLNHRFKLMITGWACQFGHSDNQVGDDGKTGAMFEAQGKHQNVIVKMQDAQEMPIANSSFLYSFGDSILDEIKSDATGHYTQGICVIGSKLTYTYKKTGQTQSIVVQKNIEEYPVTFAPIVNIHIKVVDQHNQPIQAHSLRVEYGTNHFVANTDGLGTVHFENVLYLDSQLLMTVMVEGLGTETFNVNYPECNVTMRVEVREEMHPILRVVRDGVAVSEHSIRFSGKMTGTYGLNKEGFIALEGLKVGDSFEAESMSEAEAGVQKYVIEEGKEEYIYLLPTLRTAEPDEPNGPDEPEKPEPPVNPVSVDCHVKVVKGESRTPVSEFSLRFESEPMNGTRLTDQAGVVPLENMTDGTLLKVYTSNEEKAIEFIIKTTQKEYLIQIPEDEPKKPVSISCYVKVVKGENQTPVPGYSLRFESEPMNGTRLTNQTGTIPLENMVDGILLKVYLPDEPKSIEFTINADQEEYLIQIPDDKQKEPETMACHIKLVKSDGQTPVGNYSLRIDSSTMYGNFLTDTYGILPLENMKPGSQLTCYTKMDGAPITLHIEEGKEEYLVLLDEPQPEVKLGDIMITLVDKDKVTPITPAMITLTNNQKNRFVQQNDYAGNIIVPRTFFTHNQKVRFHAEHEKQRIRDCKFKFFDDCDHYIIHLTDPFPWKRLFWLLLLPLILLLSLIRCEHDITVHTVDTKGNDIPSAMVQLKYTEHALYKQGEFFYNKIQQYQGITDKEGNYTFKDMPCSVYSYIFYSFQNALAKGSRNALSYGSTSFLFHWNKNVDVVFTNNKIVQVRSSKTNQPISQARVDINRTNENKIDTTMITDERGLCTIQESYDMLFDRIAQLTATKTGYSGTQLKDIPINENDSLPLIVYLDQPEPCQDQMANNNDRNQGNVAMRDYDMGIKSGQFILNYYTDSAPDDISVFDGSSSDYVNGIAARIFHYNGATNTTTYQNYATITFTSQFICVVVKGGTNWGYTVQCPIVS